MQKTEAKELNKNETYNNNNNNKRRVNENITLGDWGENIDPKIPEEGDVWGSLDPKSSEVNEEEVPFCFLASILFLPLTKSLKPLYENHYPSNQSYRVFI